MAISEKELEEYRENIKDKLGVDIFTEEGQLTILNETYKRDKYKFINDLVKIENRDTPGIVVDFKLWEEQKDVLNVLSNEHRIVVLKARQLGLTWLALSYSVHELIYKEGYSANIICQTEDNSKEMVRRVDFILRHLPNWLIVSKDAEEEDKEENITGLVFEYQT